MQTYVVRLFKGLGFSILAENLLYNVYVLFVSLSVCEVVSNSTLD